MSFFAKGRSIRGTRRYLRRSSRIRSRTQIQTSRVTQRSAVRMARIKGRSVRKQARAQKSLGVATAGYKARQLHKARSPGGRSHRIYKGRKQDWSKKYGGWVNKPSRRTRVPKEEVEDLSKMVKDLMPMILLLKSLGGVPG